VRDVEASSSVCTKVATSSGIFPLAIGRHEYRPRHRDDNFAPLQLDVKPDAFSHGRYRPTSYSSEARSYCCWRTRTAAKNMREHWPGTGVADLRSTLDVQV
jgi:hypothetical protein